MTYIISKSCVGLKDGSCVDVCPVDCIYTTDNDDQFYINPEECIDCAACEPVCPVEAIYADVDVPEKWEHYTALNAEKCDEYPVILESKDPLPTARTLDEIQATEG